VLNNIVEHFEQQGIAICEQAVSQRFDPHAVEFFKPMIAKSCWLLVDNNTEALPLTQRFNGLYVEDCSSVRLPNDLSDTLPGYGGSGAEEKGASIKTFGRIELLTGRFIELIFGAGKAADITLAGQAGALPKRALHLADPGFFPLERLRRENEQGVLGITRIPAGTLLEIDDVKQSIGRIYRLVRKIASTFKLS